jgi:hypothetical protein
VQIYNSLLTEGFGFANQGNGCFWGRKKYYFEGKGMDYKEAVGGFWGRKVCAKWRKVGLICARKTRKNSTKVVKKSTKFDKIRQKLTFLAGTCVND